MHEFIGSPMPGVQKQQKNILFRYSLLHLDEVLPTGSDLSNKAMILTTVFTYKYALLTKQRNNCQNI